MAHAPNNSIGRPTVITPKVVSLLIACFHSGLTVRQACWQSGISHEAYYSHARQNPEFTDTMTRAQQAPSMAARKAVVDAINAGDVGAAKWWLERKDRSEFATKSDVVIEEMPVQQPNENVPEYDSEKVVDRMLIIKWRLIKYGQIRNSNLSESEKHTKLTELYGLPEEEKLKRALADFASGDTVIPEPPQQPEDAVFNPVQ